MSASKVSALDRPAVDVAATESDEIARILLATGAVTVAPVEKYRFGSGLPSPMYVDNRRLLSMVEPRRRVCAALLGCVKARVDSAELNVIVGVPTGGLPWAAWLADDLSLPLVYVRAVPKDRGLEKQIEGVLPEHATGLVVDDLVTTGQSSLVAIEALRTSGAKVSDVVSIFSYEVPYAAELYAGLGVRHLTVTGLSAVLRVGNEFFGADEQRVVAEWRRERLMTFRPA